MQAEAKYPALCELPPFAQPSRPLLQSSRAFALEKVDMEKTQPNCVMNSFSNLT